MVRGRVQLKRIENKINRQVTFSKRRGGLLKKAHEISVLCDVEVALIVFSTKGKLFEYSTDSSMESILEKYERYTYAESRPTSNNAEAEENWLPEYPKLTARIELLQRNIRHYAGEDLDPLSSRELQSLEQQLDTALKRIRTRKNQLMHESISELQKKEKALQEQNNLLAKKLKEKEKTQDQRKQSESENVGRNISSTSMLPPQSSRQSPRLPSLTIGGLFQRSALLNEEHGDQTQPSPDSLIPHWTFMGDYSFEVCVLPSPFQITAFLVVFSTNNQSRYREYLKLKSKYESLQQYRRHLLGDDLGPLNINDLEHLEHQLETSLKNIRSTRLDEIYAENHLQLSWGGGE